MMMMTTTIGQLLFLQNGRALASIVLYANSIYQTRSSQRTASMSVIEEFLDQYGGRSLEESAMVYLCSVLARERFGRYAPHVELGLLFRPTGGRRPKD